MFFVFSVFDGKNILKKSTNLQVDLFKAIMTVKILNYYRYAPVFCIMKGKYLQEQLVEKYGIGNRNTIHPITKVLIAMFCDPLLFLFYFMITILVEFLVLFRSHIDYEQGKFIMATTYSVLLISYFFVSFIVYCVHKHFAKTDEENVSLLTREID